eukprot:SAG31_NODE_996_length_10492_cov_4.648802_7_plen_238_part_00
MALLEPDSGEQEQEHAEGGGGQPTQGNRKRAAEDETVVASKRPRGTNSNTDLVGLLREGLEWYFGGNFRVRNKARGKMLVEVAAKGGLPLAVARCQQCGWGGFRHLKQSYAATLHKIASDDERKLGPWYVMQAQSDLGVCYADDDGVAKDEAEAVRWFRKAAEQGHSDAQAMLGLCYDNGSGVAKDEAEAVRWYRKAAEQGDSDAQYSLGVCYDNGSGVAKDEAEAVRWYRKAAEQR